MSLGPGMGRAEHAIVAEGMIQMVVGECRRLNLNELADELLRNRALVIQFLFDHNWSRCDMACQKQKWAATGGGYHIWGHMTDNKLINTKGVEILPNGVVWIAHFDHRG